MFLFKLLKTETDGAYLPHGHRCLRPRQRVRVFMVFWEELRTVEMWKDEKELGWNTSEAPLSLCSFSARRPFRPFRNRARNDDWSCSCTIRSWLRHFSLRHPQSTLSWRPSPRRQMHREVPIHPNPLGLMSRVMEIIWNYHGPCFVLFLTYFLLGIVFCRK
jgi:hypothetical protein